MTDASVILWGREIGAASWQEGSSIGVFQYTPEFAASGIEVAPLTMPLGRDPYSFPALPSQTFLGLPGLLADSLPDKFGHRLIDTWLATRGQTPDQFNPVQRLCYVGRRGMGALEFEPTLGSDRRKSKHLEVASLVQLANQVLDERAGLGGVLDENNDAESAQAIEDILRVGTSAGGARAKAILAWNPSTGEFKSGQIPADAGFEPWLMKFDGISNNRDKELADPQGYGRIEYAYYLMALAAGLVMAPSRLHHEGGRSHFMTRRFDRTNEGRKLHMQSLCAIAHYDYNDPGAYSYEQAIQVMRQLGLSTPEVEQQFLRCVFNVVARNQDDHVKNIAFLMNKRGQWSLSPAFDVTYAWQPDGQWTSRHQMSVNGERDNFVRDDLIALAHTAGIKRGRATDAITRVLSAVTQWQAFATQSGISADMAKRISKAHRLDI